MRFLLFSWLFLLVLLSILFDDVHRNSVYGQCLNDQRVLLLQLNQSLSFSRTSASGSASVISSSKLYSWNSNTDCCSDWSGVTCDQEGHVISLDLSSEFISDGIHNSSSSLFKLQHLQSLNLAYNFFNSKQIPSGFDRLTNLTNLNMSNSGFAGQIPIEISRLTRLVSLDLSVFTPGTSPLKLDDPDLGTLIRNQSELRVLRLDGVNISAQGSKWCQAISSSLPNLQVLSLSNCYLSGTFDTSLLRLESLYELKLDQNNISDQVPEFFVKFSNLTSLDLTSCGLYGKFPEKILQLQTLQSLHLSENKLLHGSLPEFPQNGSLQTLVLRNTDFSGELPNSIGNLKHLSHLQLMNCGFNGSIPASMTKLDQLQYLDLSSNRFTGTIPSSRGWSENLTQINLAHNRLTGPIPPNWNKLVKLVNLNLRNNSLNGSISATLFGLPSLQTLELAQNQFNGWLHEFPNGSSPLFDTLDLSSNKLEGPIPTSIFQLSGLIVLNLASNKLSGPLSLDMFQKLRNLSSLDLSGNNLSIDTGGDDANYSLFPQIGTLKLRSCKLSVFPYLLRNQSKLTHLDLSSNRIRGRIPNWVWMIGNGSLIHLNLSNNYLEDPEQPFRDRDRDRDRISFKTLAVLDLHSNMLQGKNSILPPSASFLDYSNNNITSTIPPNIDSYLKVAIFLSFASNSLQGEIPKSICEAAGYLQVLDLSNNSLSGPIPECLVSIPSLSVLNLRGNKFNGTMPQAFPGTCSLRTLDLNRNKLQGNVSTSLANCKMLEIIDLGNNQISSIFPDWLGNLTLLRVLVLRCNKFYGPLGNGQTVNFPNLQIIDISTNNFTGKLSSECFLSWKAMMINKQEDHSDYKKMSDMILRFGFLELSHLYYQDAVTVTSKGLDMELVKILNIFTSIDLSNNGFQGEIPDVIGSLSSLYILNLSGNALTGQIPSSLTNLTQLESLDLSRNQLTGEIPVTLVALSFLSFLNLSYNKLVGSIPLGTQIQSFSASSFEGNDRLCGPPLSINCTTDIPEETPSSASGEKSKIDLDWQFIATGIGFGGGVGMVVGPLLFWKKGRKWYNEHIIRILLVFLPAGLVYTYCDHDVRVDAEEEGMGEELMEMNNDDDLEEEYEQGFHGRFCVFCTKLDITRRRAIHNPDCSCHLESPPPISSAPAAAAAAAAASSF